MKIALLLIYYNNVKDIKRLIQSIPSNSVDYLIGIDGLFSYSAEKNPDMPLLSDDGSTELLLNQPKDKFIPFIYPMPKSIEFNKRNKYLELCEILNVDVGIIIDSDEFFYYPNNQDPVEQWTRFRNNFPKLQKSASKDTNNCFTIKCFLQEDYQLMEYARVWYRPGDMRYFGNSHYHYLNIKNGEYDKFKKLNQMHVQQAGGTVTDLMLRHNHALRTKQEMKQRRDYQGYLINYESLVQKNSGHEAADMIAKNYPYPLADIDTPGTCPCESCTPNPKIVGEWGMNPKLHKKIPELSPAQVKGIYTYNENEEEQVNK